MMLRGFPITVILGGGVRFCHRNSQGWYVGFR